MLFVKYLLVTGAVGSLATAAVIVILDLYRAFRVPDAAAPVRWRVAGRLVALAWLALLPALSLVVVPSGMAGVRVSQISGTLGGTLYPGVHFVAPLVQHVELFNVRDQIFSTDASEPAKEARAQATAAPVLEVYSKEGLPVGLGVSVRYQLDPRKLPGIESSLPLPVETELMPPIVANAFRQTISNYMVRDVFSTKREEVRRLAAESITPRLAADGIIVKEVMMRDLVLPPEYAKALEGCWSRPRKTIGCRSRSS